MAVYPAKALYVIEVNEKLIRNGVTRLTFNTTRGAFSAVAHLGEGVRRAVVMLSGARGGFGGPNSLYARLAPELASNGIGAVRLSYRTPGDCVQCAIDALVALQHLADEGIDEVLLVGWSFGAAVAMAAGALARTVRGVAALSTEGSAERRVRRFRPKPILFIHGEADAVAPLEAARRVYDQAMTPKRLITYSGAGHNLAEAAERLRRDIWAWITGSLEADRAAA